MQEALAYPFNNWGGLISTLFYSLTYVAFLSIIFGRTRLIAGYNFSQILLLTFISQTAFYLSWSWSVTSIKRLGEAVKSGDIDLVLSRPVPALWYVSTRRIRINMLLFEGLPALVPCVILLWQNHDFNISLFGLITGLTVFVLGHLLIHCFQFILSLLVFWTGEAENVRKLGESIVDLGDNVPWEGFTYGLQMIGIFLIPILAQTTLTTSYLIGKTQSVIPVVLVLIATIIFFIVKIKAWQFALRHYSSASS